MSETRAALIYCPYCGDEDLHPATPDTGTESPGGARGQRPPTTSTPDTGTESPGGARGQGPPTTSTPDTGTESPGWECRSCLRVFRVSLLGLAPRPSPVPASPPHQPQE